MTKAQVIIIKRKKKKRKTISEVGQDNRRGWRLNLTKNTGYNAVIILPNKQFFN
jgi:hypothetical protein